MPLFKRDPDLDHHDDDEPAFQEETLDFDIVKRGFDPDQVADYVDQLLRDHEEAIDMAQQRLLQVQHDAQARAQEDEQQITQLTGQLQDARREITQLQEEAVALREQASQPQVIVAPDDPEKDAQLLEARGRVAQLEQELAALAQSTADPREITSLREQLDDEQSRNRELAEQIRDTEQRLADARQREADLTRELEELRAKAQAGDPEETQRLSQQLEEARAEAKRLRDRLEDVVGSGEVSDEALLAQFSDLRAESRRLDSEVQRLQEKLAESKAREEARDAHDEVLRSKLDDLEREVIALRDRHAAACAERDEAREALRTRIGDSEAEVSRLQGECDALKAQLDAANAHAEQERENAAAVTEEQQQQMNDLSRQISDLERQVSTHRQEAESARRQLQQAQDRAEISDEQIQRLTAQLEKVRADYTDALRDGAKAAAQVELLESEITQLRARQEDLGTEARRMVQALRDSRDQQERELAAEREQALADAERIREEAARDAEQIRAEAIAVAERESAERRKATDDACDAARAALADIRREVDAIAADVEGRVASARDSEQRIRDAVKQAVQAELDALIRRRDELIEEISTLQTKATRIQPEAAPRADQPVTPTVREPDLDGRADEIPARPAAEDVLPLDLSEPMPTPAGPEPIVTQDVTPIGEAEEPAPVILTDAEATETTEPFDAPAPVLETTAPDLADQATPELVSAPEVAPLDLPPVEINDVAAPEAEAPAPEVAPLDLPAVEVDAPTPIAQPVVEPTVEPLDLPPVDLGTPTQPEAAAPADLQIELPPVNLDGLQMASPDAAPAEPPAQRRRPPRPPAPPAPPSATGPDAARELAQRAAQRSRTTLDRSQGELAESADEQADGPVVIDEDD